jgi:hypothetical protein
VAPSLDSWLPKCHVRTRHVRASAASPERLWNEANGFRIRDSRALRPLIGRRLGRNAPDADATFRELFRTGIFTLLDEGERYSISGCAGKIWNPRGEFTRLESAAEYREYDAPGTCKVVFLTWVREHPRGSEIANEARVWCTDRRAWLRFVPLWTAVRPFSRLIGADALRSVARRAEAR